LPFKGKYYLYGTVEGNARNGFWSTILPI